MLAGENQVLVGPPEIQVRVAKRVDITRTTQSLTGGHTVCSILASVMHEQDREAQLTLQ